MNDILKEIIEEISEEKIVNLSSISDLSELDFWDSISRVQLIVSVEQEIERSLTDSEIKMIADVAFLTKLICK
jgi:acyl carrier protein